MDRSGTHTTGTSFSVIKIPKRNVAIELSCLHDYNVLTCLILFICSLIKSTTPVEEVCWLYTAIVRPILMYGIVIWWPSLDNKSLLSKLTTVHRTAELHYTIGCSCLHPTHPSLESLRKTNGCYISPKN